MRDLVVLILYLLATVARLAGPGGARAVVAESVLVKQQLLILNRSRQRSPTRLDFGGIFSRRDLSPWFSTGSLFFSIVFWRGLFLLALAQALRGRLPKGAGLALSALDRPRSCYELRVTT